MDIDFIVNNVLNTVIKTVNVGFIELSNNVKMFYKAGGISETLKQEGIYLTVPYIIYLLSSIKNKKVMSDKEAKNFSLVEECIKKYRGFD